jgi:hypothetical protein
MLCPAIQQAKPEIVACEDVAEAWEAFCGETKWSRLMREAGALGCKCVWWAGYPRSKSAIPLCFELIKGDARIMKGHYLYELQRAVNVLNGNDPEGLKARQRRLFKPQEPAP